jgi:hypothetical protein
MGMSTHVIGFKPPDEKWKAMYKVWLACDEGDIELPEEVCDFFEGEPPDSAGVEINLENLDCCVEYHNDFSAGYEIHTSKLPKDVQIIRFVNTR